MKKYFALIIVFVVVILGSFNINNLAYNLNENNITVNAFDNLASGEVMYLNVDELGNLISDLNIEVHSSKVISGRIVIEGYSQKISNCVVVDNLKTNIQISVGSDYLIVGSPLINGSF